MALTTLAAVKAFKGITGTEMDAALSALIPRAEAAVLTHLQRVIEQQAVIEERDGAGGQALLLAQWPVASVVSVQIDGQTIPQAASYGNAGWRLSDRRLLLSGYSFTPGVGNVAVSYVAGYAAVPADIEQAVIETTLLSHERRSHLDVSSKSLAGETISYITAELPPSAKQLLAPHRRVAPL